MTRKPCIFFDRDGIVNEPPASGDYILDEEHFVVLPSFLAALQVVNQRGYAAVIVTNQQCVSRGMIDEDKLRAIHDRLRRVIREEELELLDIYYCPHGGEHPDRKPHPGMLLRAAADHGLDLSRSWMIGDSERDIAAGHAAGCKGAVLVSATPGQTAADVLLPSMTALPAWLQQHLAGD